MSKVIVRTVNGRLAQVAKAGEDGKFSLLVDEPTALGGDDLGPTPYDFLLSALGACMSMTMKLYAERKGWNLQLVEIELEHNRIHSKDCAECETKHGFLDQISRKIRIEGDLSSEQKERIIALGKQCPVYRTLAGEIRFQDL